MLQKADLDVKANISVAKVLRSIRIHMAAATPSVEAAHVRGEDEARFLSRHSIFQDSAYGRETPNRTGLTAVLSKLTREFRSSS
jgi:hypothetical protein